MSLLPGEDVWAFKPGDRVEYARTEPGGYGFTTHVTGRVLAITQTGRVSVQLANGKRVTVSPIKLSKLAELEEP